MSRTRNPPGPVGPSIEKIADRTLDVVGRREIPPDARLNVDDPLRLLLISLRTRSGIPDIFG